MDIIFTLEIRKLGLREAVTRQRPHTMNKGVGVRIQTWVVSTAPGCSAVLHLRSHRDQVGRKERAGQRESGEVRVGRREQ